MDFGASVAEVENQSISICAPRVSVAHGDRVRRSGTRSEALVSAIGSRLKAGHNGDNILWGISNDVVASRERGDGPCGIFLQRLVSGREGRLGPFRGVDEDFFANLLPATG